ncbi:MAG: CoA-binding protein [Patescibacteria group bacterium]
MNRQKTIARELIAIIGVSNDPQKYGHKIFVDLLAAGHPVIGVNPKGGEVAGQKLVSRLEEITPIPDLVIIVVPPAIAIKVAEQAAELGIKRIWFQPGSESDEAIKIAKSHGAEVISNACYMKQQGLW